MHESADSSNSANDAHMRRLEFLLSQLPGELFLTGIASITFKGDEAREEKIPPITAPGHSDADAHQTPEEAPPPAPTISGGGPPFKGPPPGGDVIPSPEEDPEGQGDNDAPPEAHMSTANSEEARQLVEQAALDGAREEFATIKMTYARGAMSRVEIRETPLDVVAAVVADAAMQGVAEDLVPPTIELVEDFETTPGTLAVAYVAGMAIGDEESADKLEALLATAAAERWTEAYGVNPLHAVVATAARGNVDAQRWINRYATSTDEHTFLTLESQRLRHIEHKHPATPENIEVLEAEVATALDRPDVLLTTLRAEVAVIPLMTNTDLRKEVLQRMDEMLPFISGEQPWTQVLVPVGIELLNRPEPPDDETIALLDRAITANEILTTKIESVLRWKLELQWHQDPRGPDAQALIALIDNTITERLNVPPPEVGGHEVAPNVMDRIEHIFGIDDRFVRTRDRHLDYLIEKSLDAGNFRLAMAFLPHLSTEDWRMVSTVRCMQALPTPEQLSELQPKFIESYPELTALFSIGESILRGDEQEMFTRIHLIAERIRSEDVLDGERATKALTDYIVARLRVNDPNAAKLAQKTLREAYEARSVLRTGRPRLTAFDYEPGDEDVALDRLHTIRGSGAPPLIKLALFLELATELRARPLVDGSGTDS